MPISNDCAIVLTAAIIVAPGSTAVEDGALRRNQYLQAARHYARFAPVYLIEHSGYDILNDRDFAAIPGVMLRQIAPSVRDDRGKGYREFQALDTWFRDEETPPERLLKITGRYIFVNIAALLAECSGVDGGTTLIDRQCFSHIAVTSIFSLSRASYKDVILGRFEEMDDASGRWAEHVIFESSGAARCRIFRSEPDVRGISGSANTEMQAGRLKLAAKQLVRRLNFAIDPRFLYVHGVISYMMRARRR
jgi:hypothetical protein